jgi:hypothetical protein
MFRTLLLLIGLVMGGLAFTGCSTDPRVNAIQEAVDSYQFEHPEVYRLTVEDLEEQLKDFADAKQFSLAVRASAIDPSRLDLDTLLPGGKPLELESGDGAVTDGTYLAMRNEARGELKELATAASDAATVELSIPMTLAESEGEWIAEINTAPTDDSFDAELVSKAMVRSRQWTMIAAELTTGIWKEIIFPDAGQAFFDSVEIDEIAPADSGAYNEVRAALAYPDPAQVYEAAAQAVYDDYNSKTEPIFGSITEKEFEQKMDSEAGPLSADQSGAAVIKLTTRTVDTLPANELTVDMLAANIAETTDIEVVSSDVSLSSPPGEAKSDAMKPKIDKLNKEKVVKKVKLPGSKVVQGKSSGTLVKITSKGSPDKVITFKKGSKVQLKVLVRAKKSVNVRLPPGKYTLVFGSGPDWYGGKYTYGPTGAYAKSTMTIKGYPYYHTLTINTSGGNMGSSYAPYEY